MKLTDAPRGELERRAVRRRQPIERGLELGLRHFERLGRPGRPSIEALAQLAERLVALSEHTRADVRHRCALLGKSRQVHPSPRKR